MFTYGFRTRIYYDEDPCNHWRLTGEFGPIAEELFTRYLGHRPKFLGSNSMFEAVKRKLDAHKNLQQS